MNLSRKIAAAAALVVSQFTLYGDVRAAYGVMDRGGRTGNRPTIV